MIKNKWIKIYKATEHNLKNISLKIPRNRFVVVTGVSGSGKSTLVFDIIYAEAMRYYAESLGSYTRQFLDRLKKPKLEKISGLSPAICIEQKVFHHNPRSTIATMTEIYDHLRLLYARCGTLYCYICKDKLVSYTPNEIIKKIYQYPMNTEIRIFASFLIEKADKTLFESLKKKGIFRMLLHEKLMDFKSIENNSLLLKSLKNKEIKVLIDRIPIKNEFEDRIFNSLERALKEGEEKINIQYLLENKECKEENYSQFFFCFNCNLNYDTLESKNFSFNSPYGHCKKCFGIGQIDKFDVDKIVPDTNKSIAKGIETMEMSNTWYKMQLDCLSKHYNFSLDTPINKISEKIWQKILYGTNEDKIQFSYLGRNKIPITKSIPFEGIIPMMERKYREKKHSKLIETYKKYVTSIVCNECQGHRLNQKALSVKINQIHIGDLCKMDISEVYNFIKNLKYESIEKPQVAKEILKEVQSSLKFLNALGLAYLSLNRTIESLSGGEIQRIRIAKQMRSKLLGILYILDEPTIGLHEKDNEKLIQALLKLKNNQSTLIVVEHDRQSILKADYLIELGPKGGREGGYITAKGSLKKLLNNPEKSLTVKYLSGEKKISIQKPKSHLKNGEKFFEIKNCHLHNLKNIDVKIPLHKLTVITGVSGSGKSTLMNKTIYPALREILDANFKNPSKAYGEIYGVEIFKKVLLIDQTPIGRTPRSNPVTYTKIFNLIREFFAQLKDSKILGYKASRFSFNLKGGRCENCQGNGLIKVEMHFLPNMHIPCKICKGKRYNTPTLSIRYKEKSMADILDMTFEEAISFFSDVPKIQNRLIIMKDLELSHLQLGQDATTLSGGEAQRIKIANELGKLKNHGNCYLLDEPTTGLHFQDIESLLKVLYQLIENNNTVIVIEHNIDFIKLADYIIDLGPGSGNSGGEILAKGNLDSIINNKNSIIGKYLKII